MSALSASRTSHNVPCPQAPVHPKHSTLPLLSRDTIATRITAGELLVIHLPLVLSIPLSWLEAHPGRDLAILHYVGRDASNEIEMYHSGATALSMLRFAVGRVEVDENGWLDMVPPVQLHLWPVPKEGVKVEAWKIKEGFPTVLTKELVDPERGPIDELPLTPSYQHHLRQSYRKLQQHLQSLEMDVAPPFLFGYGWVLTFGILPLFFGWIYLYRRASTAFDYFCAAVVLGGFWHQLTFLGHDASHIALTGSWMKDRLIASIAGCTLGGLSISWWSNNHSVHHLVTNMPEHDPDIQHAPFLANSKVFFGNLRTSFYKKVMLFDEHAMFRLRNQHRFYYLTMSIGRINLFVLSTVYILTTIPSKRNPLYRLRQLELFCLAVFFAWFSWVVAAIPSVWVRWMFVLVSFIVTSPLHVQIVLAHYSQSVSVTDERLPHTELLESHLHRVLRTTMDIDCPEYLRFLHGALDAQIEHHLFPRMPRYKIHDAAVEVEKWIAAENELVKDGHWNGKPLKPNERLVYKKMRFIQANRHVLGVLTAVADQVTLLAKVAEAAAKGELEHDH